MLSMQPLNSPTEERENVGSPPSTENSRYLIGGFSLPNLLDSKHSLLFYQFVTHCIFKEK